MNTKFLLFGLFLGTGAGYLLPRPNQSEPSTAGLELKEVVLTEDGKARRGRVMTIRRDEANGPVYYGNSTESPTDGSDRIQLHGTFRGERVAVYLELESR